MAKSMNGQSSLFDLTISEASTSAISSPASADGPTRSDSRDGEIGPSGPGAVPVSPLARRGGVTAKMMHGICGRSGFVSSESASLQSSLENRLRVRMGMFGSPEFTVTWKRRLLPSGLRICALLASPRPTNDSGISSWPTPVANDDNKSPKAHLAMKARMGGNRMAITSLQVQAKALAEGWPTPTAVSDTGGPALSKWGGTRSMAKLRGAVGNTVLNGALNPAFPCWLMGYPDAWNDAADLVTRSSRKSRKSSSKRISTRRKG